MGESDEAMQEKEAIDSDLKNYLKSNNIEAEATPYGFYYKPLTRSGSGIKPVPREFVSIYYKLQLTTGKYIDSLSSGAPVRFAHLSTDLLPSAINLGVAYMDEGDVFRFFIPSYLAYYDLRIDTLLPAYSNIIADISLLDVSDSAGQIAYENSQIVAFLEKEQQTEAYLQTGEVFQKTSEPGAGDHPLADDQVKVSYTRKLLNGKVIGAKTETFRVGKHEVKGLNEAVARMKEGETAVLIIPSHKAFWNKAVMSSGYFSTAMVIPAFFTPDIIIPPFSTLIYEIKLVEIL